MSAAAPNSQSSLASNARLAGILYLVIIVLGIFSEVAVRSRLIVPGDATATAARIMESEGLFRLSFVSDVVVFSCDVAVAMLLYVLFRPIDRTWAQISVGFRLVGTSIYGANLLNQFAALLIVGSTGSLAAFDRGQLDALALFFLDLHKHGYDLGLVFFGVHCGLLGLLLFRSDRVPRFLAVLMGLAGLAYLVGSFTLFLVPHLAAAVAPIYVAPLVGELAFCFWLLAGQYPRQIVRAATPQGVT
jgi:hypothetical protein